MNNITYNKENKTLTFPMRIIIAAAMSSAKSSHRRALNGILIEYKDKTLTTVSTDGHRLWMGKLGIDFDCDNFYYMLSNEYINLLIKSHKEGEFAEIKFDIDNITNERFPDYMDVVPDAADCKHVKEHDTGGHNTARWDWGLLMTGLQQVYCSNGKKRSVASILPGLTTNLLSSLSSILLPDDFMPMVSGTGGRVLVCTYTADPVSPPYDKVYNDFKCTLLIMGITCSKGAKPENAATHNRREGDI